MTDFAATRASFFLPEGVIYLDGNSLGPLPRAAADRVHDTVTEEWGKLLIRGWNAGAGGTGWMPQPDRLGARIGRLLGAPAGSAIACVSPEPTCCTGPGSVCAGCWGKRRT